MEIAYLILGVVIGSFVSGVFFYGYKRRNRELQMQLDGRQTEIKRLGQELLNEKVERVKSEAEKRSADEKLQRQKEEIMVMREQMTNEFRLMANSILEEKSKRFTEINRENIDRILHPLQEKLSEFKQKVEETYDKESKERFSLDRRIKELVELNQQIGREANNLTKALKGDSKIQGDWGEMILESILEKSGLVKGREYYTQETITDEAGKKRLNEDGKRMRPDVVVVYPDQRKVIIDSKVSLTAYTRYVEAETPEESVKALQEHVRSLKSHVLELSAKNYQDYVKSLDFVMMFIPNEPAYLAAMRQDPSLWQFAYDKRVMMISPTNLIAALKLIVDLWNRDKQSRNALDIAERGAALYDKFVGFVDSMGEIGENLDKTYRSYRQAVGQLKEGKGNLIGQVEKLKALGIKAKKELPSNE
ncbi:DNA recombination protein RmuC [Coprobacter tertius]|uniref:DNA recombination protein RmuC n=1 Tax=Coprobacter tertius TaxID=2944915 RepID=A0ABT1MH79_9BACT|nr:DNA recombination protein RmuC [Coprobacter tertius]MCP9611216.1 DNA recombination protein RmuC [Coprobacter tertius]